jgi:TP901 family phage tail tape measure protein
MAGFSILAKLGLDSSKFAQSLKSQDTAVGKFGKALGTAVKAGAAIAGAAFAAFTAKGIKDMIEFDKSMQEVFTLLPDITEDSMGKMRASVRDLAKTMGVDLGDATSALYQAISAGVPEDNVFEFMEVAAKASVGGVTSLETAVDGITTAINTYGSANLTAKEAADSMFTAVKLGKTTFEELSDSLFNVLPMAKQAGVAFDEITGALAVMTASGTPTAVATTQLRAALTSLIAPTAKTAQAFKDYGLDVGSLKALMAGGDGGLVKAMQEVMVATDGDEIAIRKLLGSTEAMNAVLTLTADGAKSFGDAMVEMANKTGSTDKAFETMQKSVAHQLDLMLASIKDLGISMGMALLPIINAVLPALTNAFKDAGPWLDDFGRRFPQMLATVGDVVVILTKLGVVVGVYAAAVKAQAAISTAWNASLLLTKTRALGAAVQIRALAAIKAIANPFGLIAAGLTAVTLVLWKYIDAKKEAAKHRLAKEQKEIQQLAKWTEELGKESAAAKAKIGELIKEMDAMGAASRRQAANKTELQSNLDILKERLDVLKASKMEQEMEYRVAIKTYAEQTNMLANDDSRLNKAYEQAELDKTRDKAIQKFLQWQRDVLKTEQDIKDVGDLREKELAGMLQTQEDIDKVLKDIHANRKLEKSEIGQIHLLEVGIRDLELQKKNLIDASIGGRNLEADAADRLKTLEGDILDKREQIEKIIKGALKDAQDAEILRIKDLVTELDLALQKEKDRAKEAGDAADAKEAEVAAFRKDLAAANAALDPLKKFFQKDFKGKITPNYAEMHREFKKLKAEGKLPPNTQTIADFKQMLTDRAVAAKAHRDGILEDGRIALADATELRAKEKTALDAAKVIEDEIAAEKKRILNLEKDARDQEKKTLDELTKEREAWEKALKDWQDKLNMVPPETATLANAINQQGDTLTSIDDAIGDALNGKNQVDEEANREKTQKDLLTTAEETLSVVSGYFVNQ